MATGTVKWFNFTKGYGFITPDVGDKDVFVHGKQVAESGLRNLNEGDRLSFDLAEEKGAGKVSAVNIKKI